MNKYTTLFLTAALLAGCTSSNGLQTEAATVPSPTPAEAAAPATPEEAGQKLARRLAVRHVEDLPDADELRGMEAAGSTLVWVSANADTMVVRARAFALLRHLPSPEGRAALVHCLEAPSPHPTLRAGAARGLQPFLADADVVALLTQALRDQDPRVAHAAASVLATDPSHATILEAAATDPAVGEGLRAKIQEGGL